MWGFTLGWWNGTILVTPGNPSVFQEVPFGGYRVVVEFKDWFYNPGNRSIALDNLFENFYALEPGGSTPISPGNVLIQYEVVEQWQIPVVTIALDAPDGFYWLQRFPPNDSNYWCKFADNAPPTPFSYP